MVIHTDPNICTLTGDVTSLDNPGRSKGRRLETSWSTYCLFPNHYRTSHGKFEAAVRKDEVCDLSKLRGGRLLSDFNLKTKMSYTHGYIDSCRDDYFIFNLRRSERQSGIA